jgi:RNA recognition motif-containing protein
MNIYIGNIPLSVPIEEIKKLFVPFGQIASLQIIMDIESGQSKGFGFITMTEDAAGMRAVEKLNQSNFMGHYLEVKQVRERPETQN